MHRYYSGITIFKLAGSLLVLLSHGLLHIYIVELPNQQMQFVKNILNIVVPCFYVIAGFLAYKGWSNSSSSRLYVQKYLAWILIVYGFFCLIFFVEFIIPEILTKGLSANNLILQAKILLMTVILNGPYIQLWFIPPLVFGIIVSYWFIKKKQLRIGLIVVLIGFLISQLTSGSLRWVFELMKDNVTFLNIGYSEYLELFIKRYFGNGLIFVFAGVLLAKYEVSFLDIKVKNILVPALILSCLEMLILFVFVEWSIEYSLAFSMVPNTLLLFYGVLQIKSQAVKAYHKIINLFSIVIFFGHILLIKLNLLLLNWDPINMRSFHYSIILLLTLIECISLTYIFINLKKRKAVYQH